MSYSLHTRKAPICMLHIFFQILSFYVELFSLTIISVGSLICTHFCRKSFCRKKYYYCEITIVCQVPSRLRKDVLLIHYDVLHICVLIVFQFIIKLSTIEASSTVEKDESMPFHSKMNSSCTWFLPEPYYFCSDGMILLTVCQ
jgi:hypothetical protein